VSTTNWAHFIANDKHKQQINKNITWNKNWILQKYKERNQEHDFDLKTIMPKCMTNASFYKLKSKTIDLVANYCFDGWTKHHW
jgi:hypothetical protein